MDDLRALVMPATAVLVAAQGFALLVDELWYHRRRGLGRLEALGHPLDTLAFLAAVSVPALLAPTSGNILIFAGLSLFSALLVTKDEWLHAAHCEPGEHWLHALLFVLHGPILIGLGAVWVLEPHALLLKMTPQLVGGWALYQTIYWMTHHARNRRSQPHLDQQRVLR